MDIVSTKDDGWSDCSFEEDDEGAMLLKIGGDKLTFNLSERDGRDALVQAIDSCGSEPPSAKRWWKTNSNFEPQVRAWLRVAQARVDADVAWLQGRVAACESGTVTVCDALVNVADETHPKWLTAPYRAASRRAKKYLENTIERDRLGSVIKTSVPVCLATPKSVTTLGMEEVKRLRDACHEVLAATTALAGLHQEAGLAAPDATQNDALHAAIERLNPRLVFLEERTRCLDGNSLESCTSAAASGHGSAAEVAEVRTVGGRLRAAAAEAERRAAAERAAEERRLAAERAAEERRAAAARAEEERKKRLADARSRAIIPRAELAAKAQIMKKLRSPSTASFRTQLNDRDEFCYAFVVTYDAQNAFGAYIRSQRCVRVKITDPWEAKPETFYGEDEEYDENSAFAVLARKTMKEYCTNDYSSVCHRK